MYSSSLNNHTLNGGLRFELEQFDHLKHPQIVDLATVKFNADFDLVRSRLEVICVARELPRDVFEHSEQSHAEWRSQIRARAL